MENIILKPNKKLYFASDFHLGAPNRESSLLREKIIIKWLDYIKSDAQIVFLVGDIFDFWFEYKETIPKGYTRFLGKLAEIHDAGIEIVIFKGNHDMWMEDYFAQEFGAKIYREPIQFSVNNKAFYVGHGDGLGPGDYFYKGLKVVFESNISKFLFGRLLHSNLGLRLGNAWARHSWHKHEKEEDVYFFESKEKEILYLYCKEIEEKIHHDYYIFGHRHYKLDLAVSDKSRYFNLGDWIRFYSYGCFDGKNFELKDWKK